jgi:hypothetical protein
MPDNVPITAGSGTNIAADDISSVWYQRMKLSLGPDGTAVDAVAGAGAVGTGVQRVTLASDDPAVTDLAAMEVLLTGIDADTDAIKTAVQLLDNAVNGNELQVDVIASLPAGTNNIGDVDVATIAAGETHVGEVGGNTSVFGVTFSLDTSAYAPGDVLADTQVLTNAMRKTDGTAVLQSIVLVDKDDQGIALDVVILDANVSLGTENSAVSITDGSADNILAIVSVPAAEWTDLGGCRVAVIKNLCVPVRAASGTANLFVALITRGAPTHTASGITGRFGFLRD